MYGKVNAGKWDGFLVQDIDDTYSSSQYKVPAT